MKAFADIVTALGLSATTTVVRPASSGSIVYEAVLDSGKQSVTGIRIDVQHQVVGYLDATTWDGPASDPPPAAGHDTGEGATSPLKATDAAEPQHKIELSCDQAVMVVGSCRFAVACRWDLLVRECSNDGLDLVFGNGSDRVTTWLARMAYLLMNDFQDYLE